MVKMICFDMDGTVADFFGVNGWLNDLENENPRPYREAEPMWDMPKLREALLSLNIEVRIVTWLSMNSSEAFKAKTRKAKVEWLEKYDFPYKHFHGVRYGATKADSVRKYLADGETAILIDDNAKIREGWTLGEAIDPTAVDIIEYLENLR